MHALTIPPQSDSEPVEELRQLKYLAVVDIHLEEGWHREPSDPADREQARKGWKRKLISLLKDSPSTERKYLRWRVAKCRPHSGGNGRAYDIIENEELEVLPETSL